MVSAQAGHCPNHLNLKENPNNQQRDENTNIYSEGRGIFLNQELAAKANWVGSGDRLD